MKKKNSMDSLFKQSRLNYKEINFLGNIYDGSHNPATLSFNKVQTLSEATLNARLERGGFQNVTSSSRLNHYSLDIFGLKQIGVCPEISNISMRRTTITNGTTLIC